MLFLLDHCVFFLASAYPCIKAYKACRRRTKRALLEAALMLKIRTQSAFLFEMATHSLCGLEARLCACAPARAANQFPVRAEWQSSDHQQDCVCRCLYVHTRDMQCSLLSLLSCTHMDPNRIGDGGETGPLHCSQCLKQSSWFYSYSSYWQMTSSLIPLMPLSHCFPLQSSGDYCMGPVSSQACVHDVFIVLRCMVQVYWEKAYRDSQWLE